MSLVLPLRLQMACIKTDDRMLHGFQKACKEQEDFYDKVSEGKADE